MFREVVTAARGLIKGSKRVLAFLWLALFGVSLLAGLLLSFGPFPATTASKLAIDLLSCLLSGVMVIGVTTLGLLRAAGERVTFGALFRYIARLPYVLIVSVPAYFLSTYLPQSAWSWWWLLLLPLTLPLAFFAHFVIDREMGPVAAALGSYRLVLANLGAYLKFLLLWFLLQLPFLALMGVGAITYHPSLYLVAVALAGIAGLWLYPFLFIAQGVMYATAAGLQRDYGGSPSP